MSQSSERIAQQYIDGGVVPAEMVAQDAATKTYVDGELAIRDGRIDSAQSSIATNKATMDTHISDTGVHVTTTEKLAYNNHIANADIHVTTTEKSNWNSKAPGTTQTDLQMHVNNAAIHTTQAERDKLANIQDGAQVNQNTFSKVNSLSAASTTDEFFIVGDIGITVTTNPITKEVRITATGSATPGAHASTHITGGTDVIPDAVTNGNSGLMSGADANFVRIEGETKSGAQTKADSALTSAKTYTNGKIDEVTKDYVRQPGYAVTTGTSTAYVVTLNPAPATLSDGFGIIIVPHIVSGTNPTLNVNGLGALALKKPDGSAYGTGDLKANIPYTFRKVGTDFLAASGGGGVVISGQTQESGVYAETIGANDPVYAVTALSADNTISTYPASAVRCTTSSPDGLYLALGVNGVPRVLIYKRSGKTFTKLADPSVTPTGIGLGASFSPDGLYLAIAHATAPYITIYKRSGDTFTKLADPAVLPTGDGYSVTWSPDGVYLAVGHNTSPSLTIYKRSGDTFTKLSNPATLPTSISNGVCFSMDGVYLSVAHSVSPYITIYKRSGDTFTKLADPATLPLGGGTSISFSADSTYLALGCTVSPYIVIYKRSGDVFTKLPDLLSLPAGIVNAVTFKPGSGGYLSLAHTAAPFVSNYKQQGDMFLKLANPAVLPPGNGTAISYSNDGTFLSVGAGSSNYLVVYSVIYNQVYKSLNLLSDLASATSAGYALENGVAGETKNIILIWR